MNLYEHRVVNGVLKSGVDNPEDAARLLARDVEVFVDPSRATEFLPAAWALVTALRRQFFGNIILHGLGETRGLPTALGPLAATARATGSRPLAVGLGYRPTLVDAEAILWGDVRGPSIAFGTQISGSAAPAHPVAAFGLAGYLGFAALAKAIRVAPFRPSHARTQLTLPLPELEGPTPKSIAVLGLGQLGQAFLALLYFLYPDHGRRPSLLLVDDDRFGEENFATQVLLDPSRSWVGKKKVDHIATQLRDSGWNAEPLDVHLVWGLAPPANQPALALLGFDNFEGRRVAASWGYDWLVEAGVGTSLAQPRVTWASIPPDPAVAKRLFAEPTHRPSLIADDGSPLARSLLDTPGQCGWLTFQQVAASAPSLGLAAAAYAFCELLRWTGGRREPVRGIAHLWAPLLPYLREPA